MLETTPNWINNSAEGQYSVNFDGNQYIKCNSNVFFYEQDNCISISLWFKTTNYGGYCNLISFNGNNLRFRITSGSTIGTIYNVINNGAQASEDKTITLSKSFKWGEWNHLVVTLEGDIFKYYVNGEYAGTYTKKIGYIKNCNLMRLGTYTDEKELYTGRLDNVRIYNSILSDEDVKQLYDVKAHIDKDNNILCDNFVEEHHMFLMDEDSAHKTSGNVNDITYCDGRTIKIKINQARDWQCVWFPLEDFIDNGKTYHLHYKVNPECPKNINYDNTYGLIGIHRDKISDDSTVKIETRLTDTNLHSLSFSVDYSTYKNYRLIFFPTCTDSTSGIGKTYIYDDIDIVEVDTTKKTNISKKYQLTTGNITEEKNKASFKKHNKTECNEIIEI